MERDDEQRAAEIAAQDIAQDRKCAYCTAYRPVGVCLHRDEAGRAFDMFAEIALQNAAHEMLRRAK